MFYCALGELPGEVRTDFCMRIPLEQQVPPLRYAPVGMTIRWEYLIFLSTTELSSRPKRSGVEGPAVLRSALGKQWGESGLHYFAHGIPGQRFEHQKARRQLVNRQQ